MRAIRKDTFLPGRPGRSGVGLALLLAMLILPGCTLSIEVSPGAGRTSAAATAVPQTHALALAAVDFDPPLDYNQIILSRGVTLLVAVANQGLSEESHIRVTARLVVPDAAGGPRELMNELVVIRSLAAGELRVVRFSQGTNLPRRGRYRLHVQVEPVAGEADTGDNAHAYDILIHGGD